MSNLRFSLNVERFNFNSVRSLFRPLMTSAMKNRTQTGCSWDTLARVTHSRWLIRGMAALQSECSHFLLLLY